MRQRLFALAITTSFVPFACSCSSSYVPVVGPRLSLVIDHGNYAYVREGKKYEGGYFGGEIEEAVQGNAKAEEYARAYKSGMAGGFALTMVGAAGAVGGLILFGSQASQTSSGQQIPPTGLFVALGGLIVELIGAFMVQNAQTHLPDAINAYNDGLYPDSGSPRGGRAPTATIPSTAAPATPPSTATPATTAPTGSPL